MIDLTEADKKQMQKKGISESQVTEQIETFKRGIPYVNLLAAATIDHGIHQFSDAEKEKYISLFEKQKDTLNLLKFVPASGAATRMFKALFQFLNNYNPANETINAYVNREKADIIRTFFIGVEKFPFYEAVIKRFVEKHPDFLNLPDHFQKYYFIKILLDKDEFDYGSSPKGLLPFHKYKTHPATAFEEHMYEAALYDESKGTANLHFTISKEHNNDFDDEMEKIKKRVEEKTGVSFKTSFSFQKESTDTIAVDMENEPFRLESGEILFRPGGHGALIENLNEQDADIIFVKNIDNVVVYKYKHEVAEYKKILAGKLLEIQSKVFEYAKLLDNEEPSEAKIEEIKDFLKNNLNVHVKPDVDKYKEIYQIEFLKEKLNAPIRICGMVKNEGEPGGGPFWIKDEDGNISLQIVESPQIDGNNKFQKDILNNATHFNPVDIVCSTKNYKGEKYNLLDYINKQQAFITTKTKDGKELKALELPGLWNGGMAFWNTIFVEVPLTTFNPVKTVVDLLKPAHQVKDK
ncbi:DUF4301 family protein [Galbibacter pacificus]|uniref:DUF4301 family protein n=1 Tax=Galbibacter pacificus TaxID=2996052 RepID=A0ABT6FTG0_9FLAO|nr:DUF4301 family protein [Galbibacter pacificus]MDG3583060.1 DUF4301 family protein [Galbibacter pacificus]MDG3586541.1 DUF4301 family protein [Galbibacter pacificus]